MLAAEKTTAARVRARTAARAETNKLWIDDTTNVRRVQHRSVPAVVTFLEKGAQDAQVATILQLRGSAPGHVRRAITRALHYLECAGWAIDYDRADGGVRGHK